MTITKADAQALATFVARCRDDWDHPGIVAAIGKASHLGSPAAIGAALCRLAENRELRTPASLASPGTHWAGTTVAKVAPPVMCAEPDHSDELARECRKCRALAVTDKAELKRKADLVRAEMKRRARPKTRPEPTHDLADARARADREATT